MSRDTIVLVDLENIHLSLRQNRRRELSPAELIAAAGGWSSVLEARAYVDFRKAAFVPDRLLRELRGSGVDVLHVAAAGGGRKDLVDQTVAAQLVELAISRPRLRIVLAAADGDYAPAVAVAKRYAREISLVTVEGGALSNDLACLAKQITFLNGGALIKEGTRGNGSAPSLETAGVLS